MTPPAAVTRRCLSTSLAHPAHRSQTHYAKGGHAPEVQAADNQQPHQGKTPPPANVQCTVHSTPSSTSTRAHEQPSKRTSACTMRKMPRILPRSGWGCRKGVPHTHTRAESRAHAGCPRQGDAHLDVRDPSPSCPHHKPCNSHSPVSRRTTRRAFQDSGCQTRGSDEAARGGGGGRGERHGISLGSCPTHAHSRSLE